MNREACPVLGGVGMSVDCGAGQMQCCRQASEMESEQPGVSTHSLGRTECEAVLLFYH